MPAAVVKDGTVTPKFRQGKISPPFLTAKFSPRNSPLAKSPPPVVLPEGGGAGWQPGLLHLSHPSTHIRKFFLTKKRNLLKGPEIGGRFLGTQTFFWPLTPPPGIGHGHY